MRLPMVPWKVVDSGGRLSREHGRRFKDRGSGVVPLPLRGKVHRRDGRHRKRLSPSEGSGTQRLRRLYGRAVAGKRTPFRCTFTSKKKPAANGNEIRLRQVFYGRLFRLAQPEHPLQQPEQPPFFFRRRFPKRIARTAAAISARTMRSSRVTRTPPQ